MGIRERILARPDLNELREAKEITGLAAALNAEGLKAPQQRFVTARAIMASCEGGMEILVALEGAAANPAVAWAVRFLGQEAGLDIGDPYTQHMIDKVVADKVLTAAQGAALKAMALQPVVVTQEQVALEMYYPNGQER